MTTPTKTENNTFTTEVQKFLATTNIVIILGGLILFLALLVVIILCRLKCLQKEVAEQKEENRRIMKAVVITAKVQRNS